MLNKPFSRRKGRHQIFRNRQRFDWSLILWRKTNRFDARWHAALLAYKTALLLSSSMALVNLMAAWSYLFWPKSSFPSAFNLTAMSFESDNWDMVKGVTAARVRVTSMSARNPNGRVTCLVWKLYTVARIGSNEVRTYDSFMGDAIIYPIIHTHENLLRHALLYHAPHRPQTTLGLILCLELFVLSTLLITKE